jgi:wobble nucleotide-excising tRNase
MRKFIAFALCALLMVCAFTVVASAEEVMTEAPVVEESTVTDVIVDYVKENGEEIVVVVLMSLFSVYEARKRSLLNGSIGTLNSNAIAVAESSEASAKNTLEEIGRVSATVQEYTEKVERFLSEARENVAERERLAATLEKVEAFLGTAKLVNKELADEIAQLLVLANLPTSVKDELYARHLAAVKAIADAENTEVIHNDGKEA